MPKVNFSDLREIHPYPWEEQLNQSEYWIDRWGNKIRVEDMTTEHLQNALPYARTAARGIENRIWAMLLRVNGEMAEFYLERDLARYEEWWELPLIEAMIGELNKRGIEVSW